MARTRLAVCLVALAVAAGGVTAPQAGNLALAPGDKSPKMVAWGLDGSLETIEWKGLTLLNFWATWCEACRNEMPELQKFQDAFGDKGFRVFGFNRETTTPEKIREFLKDTGVEYPQLKPDKILTKGWEGINVLPTSYLINAEGTILRKYVGATPEQIEGMRTDIDNLLHGRPLGAMVIVRPDSYRKKSL